MLGFPQHWLAGGHVQAGGGKPSPNPAAHCKLPDAVPLEAGAAPGAVGGALLLAARACSFPNLPLAGGVGQEQSPLASGWDMLCKEVTPRASRLSSVSTVQPSHCSSTLKRLLHACWHEQLPQDTSLAEDNE